LREFGRIFLCGIFLAVLTACALTTTGAYQHRELAGKVWDVDAQRFVNSDVVLERALTSDIVLLGETHDNPAHHRVQDWLLNAISNRRPVSALAMEQYDVDQQRDIDAIVEAPLAQGTKLERLGMLMRPGWEWSGYRPLIASALHQQTPLLAINTSRDALRSVSRTGFSALGAGEAERLALQTGWSEAQQKQLEEDISDGHCGKLPEVAVTAISKAQRARDAVMADKLLAVESQPVIAILGRGHVRRDLAVPLYLATRAPGKKVLSVGIVEAGTSREPADYASGALGRIYDYVVFTTAMARESDPCEGIATPPAKDG
jgi:uncharacterized iron-regulated protein